MFRNYFQLFLPDEFMLKKYIVALVIALNILSCKVFEHCIKTDTNMMDLIKVNAITIKVKIAKTRKQVSREIDHHINFEDESFILDVLL